METGYSLCSPRYKSVQSRKSQRAFPHSGPAAWNKLAHNSRASTSERFIWKLKTHLFSSLGKLAESLGKLADRLYILSMFFLSFFNGRLSKPGSSKPNGLIFTKISGLVDKCKGLFTALIFFDFSRDVAMAPN